MARITKTIDLGNGMTQTEENRTRRVVIEVRENGTVGVTFEREAVTRINGKMIGGPGLASPVALSDAQVRAVPSFAIVFGAISQAADVAEQAMVDGQVSG